MSEAKKMSAKANAGSVKTNGAVNHLPAALAHGKAGLFIFPILEGTKDQPLIKQWGIRASCDAAQITEWWTRWPQANIGLACMKSKIAVIDSDVPNGEATLARRLLFGFGCCCLRWSCRLRLALRLDSLTKAAVIAPCLLYTSRCV